MATIYRFSKTNTWILRSFDFNSVLTRQTSEKVAFKSGFDNLSEYFLPSTFARIVSVLPEKNQKFLWLGGLQPPSPPRLVRLWVWHAVKFSFSLATLSVFKQQLKTREESKPAVLLQPIINATVTLTICVKEPDYLKYMLVRAKLQFEGFDNATQPQQPHWECVRPVFAFSHDIPSHSNQEHWKLLFTVF